MPMNREPYPPDWKQISARLRHERAGDRCECDGRCGSSRHPGPDRCQAVNRQPSPYTGSIVVLTVAHLNHDPSDTRDEMLLVACQLCHLHYDREHHAETRARTRAAAQAVGPRAVPGQEALF